MARFIGIVLAILVVLAVGAGVYGYLRGADILKSGVETYGPRYTGGSVQLADVDFSLFSSSGALNDLVIGNPSGFEGDRAFSLGRVFLDVEGRSLFGDVIHVEDLQIDQPELFVELKGRRTNIQAIQDNIVAAAGEAESRETADIIIDRLSITAPTVQVVASDLGLSEQSLTLADIQLENIGTSEGGIPPAEAARIVMDVVTPQVMRALASQRGRELLSDAGLDSQAIEGELRQQGESLKDEAEEKLKEGLGGIFGKDEEEEEDEDDDGG